MCGLERALGCYVLRAISSEILLVLLYWPCGTACARGGLRHFFLSGGILLVALQWFVDLCVLLVVLQEGGSIDILIVFFV